MNVYIEQEVQGKVLSAHVSDGEILAVKYWLGSLVGASIEDIDSLVEWLFKIKEQLMESQGVEVEE